ncbi:hypothetical protein DSCA_33870 [Desulfosarcina alkanivorans]|uniref:Radical SAM core domain-containing protein n=1 Tax=Desulfosarcina alkanivorans TaxID=571177 RepID=A0A5K7YXP9_9BACT|nr:hypothetical protein DSCA_33870 [Desulfosarcina alkanivorans]
MDSHIRKAYANVYDTMKWLLPDEIEEAVFTRTSLLDRIMGNPQAHWAHSRTKLYTRHISQGCTLCGQGRWSCLFINGTCNARCFYCPTAQDDPGQPMTNTIVFDHPDNYADYVSRYHIKGVGFSGGEPLLTFDRLLAYLKALKKRVDHPVYTWLYTNGILVNREKLAALCDGGLDEIRFDLSANGYRLETLEQALHVIPRVTVEIPAIPEDISTVKQLMIDLERLGVNHLNLHQIRCTPHNVNHLIDRGYTFVRGPGVTVLESELTALALIQYALERDISLPINYCSFAFRHQFQGMGARKRCAKEIRAGHEDITPTGYIRRLTVIGAENHIADVCKTLADRGVDASLYSISAKKDAISFSAELWHLIDFSKVRLKVGYSQAVLREGVSYRHPFKKVALDRGKSLVIEKQMVHSTDWLDSEAVQGFGSLLDIRGKLQTDSTQDPRLRGPCKNILPFETITPGLARYY